MGLRVYYEYNNPEFDCRGIETVPMLAAQGLQAVKFAEFAGEAPIGAKRSLLSSFDDRARGLDDYSLHLEPFEMLFVQRENSINLPGYHRCHQPGVMDLFSDNLINRQ
jgi:hypothetical protein